MSRIFIWLESSSILNFVSERDPDEIVQTHICHKYQAHMGLRASWFHARVRAEFKKRVHAYNHIYRMIEVPSVSHARLGHIAELGNPLKCLKVRGGYGVSVG